MKAIIGFDGYYATEDGQIVSVKRSVNVQLKGIFSRDGYRVAVLYKDGRHFSRKFHRLILEAFVGERPKGMVCRHLDGNKLNNSLSNIVWGTQKENMDDAKRHGTYHHGENHYLAKLSDKDIETIKTMVISGSKQVEVARLFNTSKGLLHGIMVGSTRSDVRPDLTEQFTHMGRKYREKFSKTEIDRIRELATNGVKTKELQELFGISPSYLSRILNRKRRDASTCYRP